MINTASLYKARYWVYASTGYYEGTALSRSPKKANALAENRAWEALAEGDNKVGYCSGIAADGHEVWRGGKLICQVCNI